jgi:hypothetical protein
MGHLHNPTDISENCVVQHLKVSYDKNRIDPICEYCVYVRRIVQIDLNLELREKNFWSKWTSNTFSCYFSVSTCLAVS